MRPRPGAPPLSTRSRQRSNGGQRLSASCRPAGNHRFGPIVDGLDDLDVIDPSQVSGGDREVGVTELSLDHDQRDPLARHLDRMRMSELMRREPATNPGSERGVVELLADARRPRTAGRVSDRAGRRTVAPAGRLLRSSSQGSRCDQAQRSIPTSRRLSPLPWRTSSAPRSGSRSVSLSASASLIRSPARQSITITPRSLTPSGLVSGRAHHGDDLLHGRRVGWIPKPLVTRREAW